MAPLRLLLVLCLFTGLARAEIPPDTREADTVLDTLAVVIGFVQGGIQALSRSFYSRLIPHDQAAEFYGFYNLLGKFAVIFGPILIGLTGLISNSPRVGIASIAILFIMGGILLYFVDEKKGQEEAKLLVRTVEE